MYNRLMEEILKNPCSDVKLAGMTYMYHADALKSYPKVEYKKIKTPFLVVNGQRDSTIYTSGCFCEKSKRGGCTGYLYADCRHGSLY